MPGKGCLKNADLHGGQLLKPGCIPKEKVGDLHGRSSKIGGKGLTQEGNALKFGGSRNMQRAVMTNWVEEKNKLYVQRLEKNLNIRLREIDREMGATDKFLEKLYKTTGHLPKIKFW